MKPNGSAELVAVFSPQRTSASSTAPEDPWVDDEGEQGLGSSVPVGQRQPTAWVDDEFFFRRTLYASHCSVAQFWQNVPRPAKLCFELLLFGAALLQLTSLAAFHWVLIPSSTASQASDPLALLLAAALRPNSTNGAVELLHVEVELPGSRICSHRAGADVVEEWHSCAPHEPQVFSCDFAAEAALLRLPSVARQRAALNVSMLENAVPRSSWIRNVILAVPGMAVAAATWQVLGAMMLGPFLGEVKRKEAAAMLSAWGSSLNLSREKANSSANDSIVNSSRNARLLPANQVLSLAEKWPTFFWGIAEVGLGEGKAGDRSGGAALSFVACQGQPTTALSLQPLRRLAELLHGRVDWWLFKSVWAFSTAVSVSVIGVAVSFAIRSSLLSIFKLAMMIRHPGSRTGSVLDILEALVLIVSPIGLTLAIGRSAGCAAWDMAAILLCVAVGEVASLCALHTQESRYLFPRTVIPAYAADMCYTFFHPFGFTMLSHSCLFCYQAFLILICFGRFESAVQLPQSFPGQLSVEVQLRPVMSSLQSEEHFKLSPAVQKILLEQGLLLMGDDKSYESSVIMSAIISRTVQNAKVPCLPPRNAPPSSEALLLAGESLKPLHPEALGGGAAVHMLLNRAFAGDARCGALLVNLADRMQKSVQRWPPVMQLPPQVRGVQMSAARRSLMMERNERVRTVRFQAPWRVSRPSTPPLQPETASGVA
eukprot:TRINITY_DN29464_c0_g1_i1.p1 TRINITY_DN29464_c0_g1~~TRINITY_DN29464_c0_g1_i1.p1  ORF type:complete len:711 (-),score=126.36 TRINITY_DN29464_c0_g1_i1:86-2218(-)